MLVACLGLNEAGTLVDRVVVVVDKQVIVQSEFLVETRVALARREGGRAAAGPLTEELLEGMRDYLIDQLLVSSLVRRAGDTDVSREEVDVRLQAMSNRFRSAAAYEAFLRRFGITEDMVRSILRREIRNERFVAAQMRAWLLEGDGILAAGRQEAALKDWLQRLRAAAKIRYLGPRGDLEEVR